MLKTSGPAGRRARLTIATLGLAALALAGAGLYGSRGWWGNMAGACAPSGAALARLRPLARGELAAFEVEPSPRPAPDLAFVAPSGAGIRLADLRGRTVLLNLWATWCEPCKREMPALDRLQAELGGDRFGVVAVNIDTRNLDRPKAWLASAGVSGLAYYSDSEARIFQDLRRVGMAEGMPTTLLVDASGCLLGRLSGPAEWGSPEGLGLIRAAMPTRPG